MSNPIADLAAAHAAVLKAQHVERSLVRRARRSGASWSAIARAVGMSVTGAASRFGNGAPEPMGLPGWTVREYAKRVCVPESAIRTHLDDYNIVVLDHRGRRRVRVLGRRS